MKMNTKNVSFKEMGYSEIPQSEEIDSKMTICKEFSIKETVDNNNHIVSKDRNINKGTYNNHKRTYHICLSSGDEVMFRTQDDYYRGFNCYALALAKTDSSSLADVFMSNHFHIVVRTSNPVELMRSMRSSYSQYFNKKYQRNGKLGSKNFYLVEINGLYHHLAAISYVLRNPLHHGVASTPFGYEHSSVNVVFRKELGRINLENPLPRKLHYRYIGKNIKSPEHYEMSKRGVYLRESVVDLQAVEHMYLTPRAFDYYMNRKSGEEWSRERQKDNNVAAPFTLESMEREYIRAKRNTIKGANGVGGNVNTISGMDDKVYKKGIEKTIADRIVRRMMSFENGRSNYNKMSDIELCTYIDNMILPKLGRTSVYCLSDKEKFRIGEFIHEKFHLSASQIKRCLVLRS